MKKRQLAAAVRTGSPEFIVELFRRHNNPKDRKGRTLLHYAARVPKKGAAHIASLAAAGAGLDAGDRNGRTALHYAARYGNAAAIEALAAAGAGLDAGDRNGRTALHYAARDGNAAAIEALAAAGAGLDAADNRGFSPLHYAARNENYAAFVALVGCGGNPALKDPRDRTPLRMLGRPGRYPHDAIARFVFGYPVMARGLLRTVLPADLVPEDAAIRRIDGELVSHSLSRALRSDMILVLEPQDSEPLSFIVEFQSAVDRAMAERMASYRIELTRTIRRNHKDLLDADDRVPFTVPVVVHTGADAWNAADDAERLIAPPKHAFLEPYRTPARYVVHDVQRMDYSAYQDNPAAAYFRLHQGDPADTLRACEELDRLLPVDEPLRHLLLTMTALGSEWFPETALEGSILMTGFAQHYDAAVERALASDARAEASDARAEASMALNRELVAKLAAERFGTEAGERLKSVLDGIVDPERFQEATAHVADSLTSDELFAFFDKRR